MSEFPQRINGRCSCFTRKSCQAICSPRQRRVNLTRATFLYRRGDRAHAAYVVLNDRSRLFSFNTGGKPVPLYVVRSGECVSEAALFADLYCSEAVAEVRSRVRSFPKEALRNTLRDRPKLAAEFMALQAQRFNCLRTSLEIRVLRSARERILQYLQMTNSAGPQNARMDRPPKCLAEDLGLSPESFYRNLTQLIEKGLVVRSQGTLRIAVNGICVPPDADRPPFQVTHW